jgi:hypothetical protein
MSKKENKLEISGQYLHCPLLLSIDTYEGCPHECRYCFARSQYKRQNRGKPRPEPVRPALLTAWERALNGEHLKNPMIEYLVSKRHPIQLGTKSDPFPKGIEPELKNTRKFIEMCNKVNYPVYISTKNTDTRDMPVEILAKGNYILGVSLASHKADHIQKLERNTSRPLERIRQIPQGVFKKIIVKWHPFIPQLFKPGNGRDEKVDWSEIDRYLDGISGTADAVSLSFLADSRVWDHSLLEEIGPDDFTELEEVAILTYIKEQAHIRNLEFYTSGYPALSDSPICCGLRGDEFEIFTPWVWSYLVWNLYTGEKPYLIVKDLVDAFPGPLKDKTFAGIGVALFSQWARYIAKKTTILEEYIRNFIFDRTVNPVNLFAGLYSRVVDGEFRIYFKDYRRMIH